MKAPPKKIYRCKHDGLLMYDDCGEADVYVLEERFVKNQQLSQEQLGSTGPMEQKKDIPQAVDEMQQKCIKAIELHLDRMRGWCSEQPGVGLALYALQTVLHEVKKL